MSASPRLAAPEPSIRAGEELAVVDVGSNTARLVVFDTTAEGGFRSVFESKEVPRLGKDVGSDGSLADEAIDRGVAALRRFARQLEAAGGPPTFAVATSAVRDAPNAPAFLNRIRRDTGIGVQVLSGEDEGRYAFLGVAGAFELGNDRIVDLGGGSLQSATTREGRLAGVVSRPLGALRLTQHFLEHDPPKRRELDDLRAHVRAEIDRLPPSDGPEPHRLFGVGGTIRCLARVSIELDEYPLPQVHGYRLRREELDRILERIAELPAERRRQIPGISGHRADVIVAGLVVVDELLRSTSDGELLVSGTGIREGIVLERIGSPLPAAAETLTYRSVTAAARAFGFSLPHGEEVKRMAVALFDLLQPRFGWSPEVRRALSVAAWMHDVGTVVEIWRHPRHSAYLLRHGSILGLTHRETVLAALAAYQHEGDELPEGSRKEWRLLLGEEDFKAAEELGALLFFAETLDGAQVHLNLPRGSQRLHLRPAGGPGSEASERALERLKKAMAKAFDLEVVVDGRP